MSVSFLAFLCTQLKVVPPAAMPRNKHRAKYTAKEGHASKSEDQRLKSAHNGWITADKNWKTEDERLKSAHKEWIPAGNEETRYKEPEAWERRPGHWTQWRGIWKPRSPTNTSAEAVMKCLDCGSTARLCWKHCERVSHCIVCKRATGQAKSNLEVDNSANVSLGDCAVCIGHLVL